MKKNVFVVTLVFAVLALLLADWVNRGYSSETKESMPMATTITGEVVDLVCYLGMGKDGASHAQCAVKCAKMGIPFGIKTEDGIYVVLFGNKKAKAEYDKIGNQGGKKVTVKGMVVEKEGVKAILVGPAEM